MESLEKYKDGSVLFDGHYKLLRLLSAEGGSADVWLAEDADTVETRLLEEDDKIERIEGSGVLVAIKIYRPKNVLDIDGEQNFRQEFKTVFSCHHANLLQPTDYSMCDGMPYLVMPFCEKGSAEQYVGRMAGKNDLLWKFIYDVASGLAYLHACSPQIIHQDIKPANILIDPNDNFCITDFGISVKSGNCNELCGDNENSGTTIYMPPERFDDNYEAVAASDIWSLGATVYELITGDVPFGAYGGSKQRVDRRVPHIKVKVSSRIKQLVYSCLNPDPAKRPTAEQIVIIAKAKGRSYKFLYVLGGVALLGSALFVGHIRGVPMQIDEFTVLCNKGDSIVNIEKQDARMVSLIHARTSETRLRDAVETYEEALKEVTDEFDRREQIERRILSVKQDLLPVLSLYQRVCDTLRVAEEDDVPIRIDEYMGKRKKLSDLIKIKLMDL